MPIRAPPPGRLRGLDCGSGEGERGCSGDRERRESSRGVPLPGLRERSRREKTACGARPPRFRTWCSWTRLRLDPGPACGWGSLAVEPWSSALRVVSLGDPFFSAGGFVVVGVSCLFASGAVGVGGSAPASEGSIVSDASKRRSGSVLGMRCDMAGDSIEVCEDLGRRSEGAKKS